MAKGSKPVGGNRFPTPLPPVGASRGTLDPRAVVATTFHPGKDIWWVCWCCPPALITVTDGRVSAVTPYDRGLDAFNEMLKLSDDAKETT